MVGLRGGSHGQLRHVLVANPCPAAALDEIPVMTIGSGGGRIRTGLHISGNGDPITRIGLTAQQIMGVSADRWGVGALQVSKPVDAIRV